MGKVKKAFEKPLILPGEAVFQLDPLNRQLFEWDELKRSSRKKRIAGLLNV